MSTRLSKPCSARYTDRLSLPPQRRTGVRLALTWPQLPADEELTLIGDSQDRRQGELASFGCRPRSRARYGQLDRPNFGKVQIVHRRRDGPSNGGRADEACAGQVSREGRLLQCELDAVRS